MEGGKGEGDQNLGAGSGTIVERGEGACGDISFFFFFSRISLLFPLPFFSSIYLGFGGMYELNGRRVSRRERLVYLDKEKRYNALATCRIAAAAVLRIRCIYLIRGYRLHEILLRCI